MKKQIFLVIVAIAMIMACKNETTTPSEDTLHVESMEDSIDALEMKIDSLEMVVRRAPVSEIKSELQAKGYKTFDYVDEETRDTILMQQYFMAFLKKGPIRSQNEEEAQLLQEQHLGHLRKMYDLGYADISGPFGDDSDIRGITVYNVPTLKMADSLANADPMVKAGRLVIEIHPWWAAKGFPLR